MLEKLNSQVLIEAYRKLIGSDKQGQAVVQIGNTVQPIVDVNSGFDKVFMSGLLAGNVSYTLVVPTGKVWELIKGAIYIDTDATVANRFTKLMVYNPLSGTYNIDEYNHSTGTAANSVVNKYIHKANMYNYAANHARGSMLFLGDEQLVFDVTSGVAGDVWNVIVHFKEYDVK